MAYIVLRITRKLILQHRQKLFRWKSLRIVFYIWINSQKHQNPILCFILTKFTILYSLVKTGQLSIILEFDNFVNGFINFCIDICTCYINKLINTHKIVIVINSINITILYHHLFVSCIQISVQSILLL